MARVVVTGGSGKAGRAVVRDLVDSGHDVLNVDAMAPSDPAGRYLRADLADMGEAIEALRGADSVIHLAAIPAPGMRTVGQTFEINTLSTYNVFSAATQLGLERVVWASSETVLGLPFGTSHARNLLDAAAIPGHVAEPDYVPIDELHPRRPHSSYSLSKVMGEDMAVQFARWSGIPFVGLRFSAIREPAEYEAFGTRRAIRTRASGTSGATWTPATSPRPAGSASRPRYPGRRCSSSPQRTQHRIDPTPSCSPRASRP